MNEQQQSDFEVNSRNNQSKLMQAVLAVAGRGLLFLISYMLYELLLIVIAINGGSAIERIFDIRWLNDYGIILLMILYAIIAGLPLAGYGYFAAKRFPSTMWIHVGSTIPVAFIGWAIWYAIFTSVKGAASDFGGVTWLPFQLFVLWALPLFDTIPHYISVSHTMKLTVLIAAFWPSLFAIAGIYGYQIIRNPSGARYLIKGSAASAAIWLLLFLFSCFWPNHHLFNAGSYPRIDGATAAVPFGQILMRELTGTNKPWSEKHVYFNTTHAAYENLIAKKADLIFVAGPSEEELKFAEENGVKLKLTPIGKDAFIFLVHRDNQVNQLTVQQIQDIYTGKITSWGSVGGLDQKIIAFQREKNSGSQTYMEQKVMKGLQLAEPPMEKKGSGMGGLIDTVADYKNGSFSMGYSFYYFANEMHKREQVKFLSIDGVEGNKENIRKGTYPYTAILYAVTRDGEPADSSAGRLLQWLQSNEGRDAMERGGFVPVEQ